MFFEIILVLIIVIYLLYVYYTWSNNERYLKKYYSQFKLESMTKLFDRVGIKKNIKCEKCKNELTAIYYKSHSIIASSYEYVHDVIIDGCRDITEFNKRLHKEVCSICERVVSVNDSLNCKLSRYSINETGITFKHKYPYQECKIGMIYLCECCNKRYCVNCMNPKWGTFNSPKLIITNNFYDVIIKTWL